MSWNDVSNLYLTFSISFLALLTSIFLNVSENYRLALFTTLSFPVLYTAKYYKSEYGKYFKKLEDEAVAEMQILLASFFAGYIMYITTTEDFSINGLYLFGFAFALVLVMKYVLQAFYSVANTLDMNPDNPFVILGVSFVISCTFFLIEVILLPYLSGVIGCSGILQHIL